MGHLLDQDLIGLVPRESRDLRGTRYSGAQKSWKMDQSVGGGGVQMLSC